MQCWGAEREAPGVHAHRPWDALAGDAPHLAALRALLIDLTMAAAVEGAGAGRARAIAQFAWPAIAEQTSALYRELVASRPPTRLRPPPPARPSLAR